jgi:ADP-L-glycero-D-manno-heptose 6-epimerase
MYVVTGGAGFIGSNIVAALERRGARDIVVVDRLRSGDKWRNVSKRGLADIVHPDRVLEFLETHVRKVEAVIHMGAISSTTETDADKILANNFSLTLALWKWCTAREKRFIYASSAATYGDGGQGFADEFSEAALARLRPMNPYGWSKHLFDRRVAAKVAAGLATPPQWAGLKFFNVYGPNEYHKGGQQSVIAQVYPRAAADAHCLLFKSHNPDYQDGGQLRDFVWVGDCAAVVMWLLDNPGVSGLFNLGTGQARSFVDLASAVYKALGKTPKIKFVDTPVEIRDRYQYFTQADMRSLRAAGYDKPFTSLESGIRQYVVEYLHTDDPYV